MHPLSKLRAGLLGLAIVLSLLAVGRSASAVTVTAATFEWNADDATEVWLNGTSLLAYTNCGGTCYKGAHSIALTGGQLTAFGPCNVIAATVFDLASGEGFFSY